MLPSFKPCSLRLTRLKPDGPSQAQVDYVKRLTLQLKREPISDEKLQAMSSSEIGALISELLAARGKPVHYGNGQFMRWR